jgi:hypothetical protein
MRNQPTDTSIREAFSKQLRQDPKLLDRLVAFLSTLTDAPEDQEEVEPDEEEDVVASRPASVPVWRLMFREHHAALTETMVPRKGLGRPTLESATLLGLSIRPASGCVPVLCAVNNAVKSKRATRVQASEWDPRELLVLDLSRPESRGGGDNANFILRRYSCSFTCRATVTLGQ